MSEVLQSSERFERVNPYGGRYQLDTARQNRNDVFLARACQRRRRRAADIARTLADAGISVDAMLQQGAGESESGTSRANAISMSRSRV